LREQLLRLAREKPRFGYRRLHILPEREGTMVNHKRVQRVYRELGLSVKRTRRKKLMRMLRPQPVLSAPNQEWAIDFVSDMAASGQRLRIFSVVDSFTRECLALEDECLNVSWFWNLFDARRKIARWREEYNQERPHSALNYRTPEEFARQWSASPSLGPTTAEIGPASRQPCGLATLGLDPGPPPQ
jgi:transposase InsO family protein